MPYDPHLAERMRKALQTRAGIVEKKMFGGVCWMLNGNMLCGVEVGRFMFRVGKDREAQALRRPGASAMDITGRPMAGFLWVDAAHTEGAALDAWIRLAAEYVEQPRQSVRAAAQSGGSSASRPSPPTAAGPAMATTRW